MDLQKENNLIQEAFEVEVDETGFCLDQKWGDYENPYENSDTALAFNLFKKGWQAKAQAVPEWFDYTKQSPQMDGNYQIFIKGEQITAKWVSRFGFADPIEGDALRQELITHWAMQPQSPKAQEPAND
ncbi:hypothetical protein [Acinetobacter indicus]|uniref:hypothetical protein n=1 Tax=Acinetobacter indicus TaxID=756892 RepID=UPI000CEC4C32|nr:hypothetical protein [Acinetobacter indicus]